MSGGGLREQIASPEFVSRVAELDWERNHGDAEPFDDDWLETVRQVLESAGAVLAAVRGDRAGEDGLRQQVESLRDGWRANADRIGHPANHAMRAESVTLRAVVSSLDRVLIDTAAAAGRGGGRAAADHPFEAFDGASGMTCTRMVMRNGGGDQCGLPPGAHIEPGETREWLARDLYLRFRTLAAPWEDCRPDVRSRYYHDADSILAALAPAQGGDRAATDECGVEFARHSSQTHLVAICTLAHGHAGDHDNLLGKPGAKP